MKKLPTIAGVAVGTLIGIYLVLFAIFNRTKVVVDMVVSEGEIPIYVVTAISFLCGSALVGIAFGLSALRHARHRKGMARRMASLTEEVKRLRNAPLSEPPEEA